MSLRRTAIAVQDYERFSDLLVAYFEHMRGINTKYSKRFFARKMGYMSPSLLSMIASGRRKPSAWAMEKLMNMLQPTDMEKEYCILLMLTEFNGDQELKRVLNGVLSRHPLHAHGPDQVTVVK